MKPHPETERLSRALRRCLSVAGTWTGDVYRFAAPRWSTANELLSGKGARKYGGRWCPIGLLRAVDTSLDPATALEESLSQCRRFGISIWEAMPKTLNAIQMRLHRVLAMTEGSVRHRLGVSWDRLLQERWWEKQEQDEEALTQALGRIAWECDLEALLVPSAANPGGVNLVYFPECKLAESMVAIRHVEELPRQVP